MQKNELTTLLFNRSFAAHNEDRAPRAADGDAQLPVERPRARGHRALLDVGGGPGEQPHLPPRILPRWQEAGRPLSMTAAHKKGHSTADLWCIQCYVNYRVCHLQS